MDKASWGSGFPYRGNGIPNSMNGPADWEIGKLGRGNGGAGSENDRASREKAVASRLYGLPGGGMDSAGRGFDRNGGGIGRNCRVFRRSRAGKEGAVAAAAPASALFDHDDLPLPDHAIQKGLHRRGFREPTHGPLNRPPEVLRSEGSLRHGRQTLEQDLLRTLAPCFRSGRCWNDGRRWRRSRCRWWWWCRGGNTRQRTAVLLQKRPHLANHLQVSDQFRLQPSQGIRG